MHAKATLRTIATTEKTKQKKIVNMDAIFGAEDAKNVSFDFLAFFSESTLAGYCESTKSPSGLSFCSSIVTYRIDERKLCLFNRSLIKSR